MKVQGRPMVEAVTIEARKLGEPTKDAAVITTYFSKRDAYRHAAATLASSLLSDPADAGLRAKILAEATPTEKKGATALLGELATAHLLESEGHLLLLVHWNSRPFETKTGTDVATVSPEGLVHYIESKFAGTQICQTPFLKGKLLADLKKQLDKGRMTSRFESKTAAEGLLALSLALRQSPQKAKPAALESKRFGRLGSVLSATESAWITKPLPDALPDDASAEFPVTLWHIEVANAAEVAQELLVLESAAANQTP